MTLGAGQDALLSNTGMQFGLINMFRTGNPMLDMALAMLIPALLTGFYNLSRDTIGPKLQEIYDYFSFEGNTVERSISFQVSGFTASASGLDQRNNILHKAISLFLTELNKTSKTKIQFQRADLSLQAAKEKVGWDSNAWEPVIGSTVEQLNAYRVNILPQENEWCIIEPNLKFKVFTSKEDESSGTNKTTAKTITYQFKSYYPGQRGHDHIERWIERAFNWYKDEIGKSQDDSTYMYVLSNPSSSSSDDHSQKGIIPAQRYRLSNRKTFDSIFFPEKAGLLKLVDQFQNGTGKYAIPGYPKKLGLLLHGVPGSGKTSTIKALAAYTNRNIINVNLSRVKTNQELMDIVYTRKYDCPGEDMPVQLSFKDCIFVFEDIDAASKVVLKRPGTSSVPRQTDNNEYCDDGATISSGESDSVNDEDAGGAEAFDDDSVAGDSSAALLGALLSNLSSGNSDKVVEGPVTKSAYASSNDKLNLSGLLNCFDGILDSEDRMLICTTNRVNALDSALIRPGRLDRRINLSYVKAEAIISMTALYFGTVSPDQKQTIKEIFATSNIRVTPAQVEQLASEMDDVESFIKALTKLQNIF